MAHEHQILTVPPMRATIHHCMSSDPILIAYSAKRSPNSGRTRWTAIGKAYPHETGAGLTVILEAVPLDGRIILLELDEDDHARHLRDFERQRSAARPDRKSAAKK